MEERAKEEGRRIERMPRQRVQSAAIVRVRACFVLMECRKGKFGLEHGRLGLALGLGLLRIRVSCVLGIGIGAKVLYDNMSRLYLGSTSSQPEIACPNPVALSATSLPHDVVAYNRSFSLETK